ncbi:hypothetical protein [Clostridium sardiniense]|uniref:hypothetical protein n=1 Tax=Clostridium sardiniense TaxID=29369 RepID=UPI00195BCAB6|nr:hypothetical protein [Clostridium sardiniense]MBM7833079.1 TM2 domain-containing membrane protein YozV [Clostridium sardiniense]
MNKNDFNRHIYLKGKGIKYDVLVDDKNNLKVVPYNFDYLTFLFGGLAYLFRKEIIKGIALLFLQGLLIYLLNIPIGIILSFIITFIVGVFSGKAYSNKLIREGAIPFDEYEENGYSHEYKENISLSRADEKKGARMNQGYKHSIKKQNTIFCIAGILMLIGVTLLTGFKVKSNSHNTEYKAVTTQSESDSKNNDKKIEIPSQFIILLADDKNIESFALINFDKDKHKMSGKYYNGEVLVKEGDKAIPLNDVFKDKGIIPDGVFKKYFGIDKSIPQVKVDIKQVEEIMPELKDSKVENKYKDILINTTKLDDEKYEKIVSDASILNKVDDKVEENYLDYDAALKYKNIIKDSKETFDIKKGKYYEVSLNSIASNKAIKALGDEAKGDVLYYFDYNDLEYNDLVKKLKAKNKEIKDAEEEATNTAVENNNSNRNNNRPQNSSGSSNYYRPQNSTNRPSSGGNHNTSGGNGNNGNGNTDNETVDEDKTDSDNQAGGSNAGSKPDQGNDDNGQAEGNGDGATQNGTTHHRR